VIIDFVAPVFVSNVLQAPNELGSSILQSERFAVVWGTAVVQIRVGLLCHDASK